MNQTARDVDLLAKQRPRQARAKRTYETILSSAAELLLEVGIERISTNLIAERAGVTVPALYRYFPNKYAVIHALGLDLMQRQNSAFQAWLSELLENGGADDLLDRVHEGLVVIYRETRDVTAGIEIFHALRAMVPLREQRMQARREATDYLSRQVADLIGVEVSAEMTLKARTTVDISCGIVETALEDDSLDPEAVLREGAAVLLSYWRDVLQAAA